MFGSIFKSNDSDFIPGIRHNKEHWSSIVNERRRNPNNGLSMYGTRDSRKTNSTKIWHPNDIKTTPNWSRKLIAVKAVSTFN